MKKSLILVLLFFYFLIQNISQADVNTRYEIDDELGKCLEKSQNYLQKTQCNYDAIEKYNKEIDEALSSLKSLVSDSQYKEIFKSQEKWKKSINQDNIMLKLLLEKDFQHHLMYTSSTIKLNQTRARAIDLTYIYYNLKYMKK